MPSQLPGEAARTVRQTPWVSIPFTESTRHRSPTRGPAPTSTRLWQSGHNTRLFQGSQASPCTRKLILCHRVHPNLDIQSVIDYRNTLLEDVLQIQSGQQAHKNRYNARRDCKNRPQNHNHTCISKTRKLLFPTPEDPLIANGTHSPSTFVSPFMISMNLT